MLPDMQKGLYTWNEGKDWGEEIILDFPGGLNEITWVLKKWREGQKEREGGVTEEEWSKGCKAADGEDGERATSKEYRWPPEAGKGKEMDSPFFGILPWSLQKKHSPANPWTLAHWDPHETMTYGTKINLYRFKALSLW